MIISADTGNRSVSLSVMPVVSRYAICMDALVFRMYWEFSRNAVSTPPFCRNFRAAER